MKLAIVWFLYACFSFLPKCFLWVCPLKYARGIRKKARFFFLKNDNFDSIFRKKNRI